MIIATKKKTMASAPGSAFVIKSSKYNAYISVPLLNKTKHQTKPAQVIKSFSLLEISEQLGKQPLGASESLLDTSYKSFFSYSTKVSTNNFP